MSWDPPDHEDVADGTPGTFDKINDFGRTLDAAHGVFVQKHDTSGLHNDSILPRGWGFIEYSGGLPYLTTRAGIVQSPAWASVFQEDASGGPSYVDITTDTNDAGANDASPFPAGAAVDDAIYLGMPEEFELARFNVGTAGIGTYTMVWEGYTGSWVDLSETDGTNAFKNSGVNEVTFTRPVGWVATTINGVSRFWIRGKRDGGTVTTDPIPTPSGCREPYGHRDRRTGRTPYRHRTGSRTFATLASGTWRRYWDRVQPTAGWLLCRARHLQQ